MNNSSIKILLVLVGLGLVFVSIMLVAKPKNETIKALKAEIAELQTRYDDLCAKEDKKDEFIKETQEFNDIFDAELVNYPADLNQETAVMFMKGTEEAQEYENLAIALPEPSTYYVLGQGAASADGTVPEVDEDEGQPYVVETTAYGITYQGSYDGIKDYLAYIADYKYRMNISSITIAYDDETLEEGEECKGSVVLNAYSISGPDRTPEQPTVDVKEGKDVIFEDVTGGTRASTSFDEDNGASIVSNHNLIIMLNNANNDTASGIIVASSESNESTYVTSSENSEQTLDINITEEDGKNYMEYSIGGNSYKAEILSNNVTIYVKSSARVDSDDTNGVKANINNSTALSVYIKVDSDDSTSPRFSIGSKSGIVKTY